VRKLERKDSEAKGEIERKNVERAMG